MIKTALRCGALGLMVATLLVAGAAAPAVALPAASHERANTLSNTLYSGQRLVAHTARDTLTSTGGKFELRVYSDLLDLIQQPLIEVWFADDRTGRHQSSTDRTVLAMQRNGNLVLRTSRHVKLWESGTRGTGNRAVVFDNGNLIIRSAAGRALWATHTSARYLRNGETLASGARMNQRWGYFHPHQFTSLVMRRDGNLVFQCNGKTWWSTHTHVPGSSLTLLHDGNLVVRTPRGHIVWRSHTGSTGPHTTLDSWYLSIVNARLRAVWSAPLASGSACD